MFCSTTSVNDESILICQERWTSRETEIIETQNENIQAVKFIVMYLTKHYIIFFQKLRANFVHPMRITVCPVSAVLVVYYTLHLAKNSFIRKHDIVNVIQINIYLMHHVYFIRMKSLTLQDSADGRLGYIYTICCQLLQRSLRNINDIEHNSQRIFIISCCFWTTRFYDYLQYMFPFIVLVTVDLMPQNLAFWAQL